MRLTGIRLGRADRPNWALPFMAGFIAGIVCVYLRAGHFTTDAGFLDLSSLERLKYMDVNSRTLLFYVLKKRIGILWLLAVLATTFAGIVAAYGYVMWLGMSAGMVLTVLVIRYGIKGCLLFAGGTMPHFLFYIPACIMLVNWCYMVCVKLYYPGRAYGCVQQKAAVLGRILLIHGVVIIGTVLESYVNPNLMTKLLQFF